jgi:GNAT superfamily N-acetyltransferase
MSPLAREKADAFWRGVAEGIAAGERVLLAAQDRASGEIFGTVQLVFGQPENQPHRADVAKTLVHRRARRRGLGAALMRAAEDAALAAGKSAWAGRGSVRCQATPCPHARRAALRHHDLLQAHREDLSAARDSDGRPE